MSTKLSTQFSYGINHTSIFQFIPVKLVNGDEIVRSFDRYCNETVTLRKHVTKYKHMRKWIVEFLSKSESRCNEITRVNSIRITKSINLL